ncbi:hypothetical protein MHYP_G00316590 [Metynnis hypsauchen]
MHGQPLSEGTVCQLPSAFTSCHILFPSWLIKKETQRQPTRPPTWAMVLCLPIDQHWPRTGPFISIRMLSRSLFFYKPFTTSSDSALPVRITVCTLAKVVKGGRWRLRQVN